MQVLPNVLTADAYSNTNTLEDDSADTLTFVIGNAAVLAQFRTLARRGGARLAYGPEILLTPQTNQIKNVNGARFRSAVAGTPARVVAQLTGPDDPQISGGTPFSGTLQASGQVNVAAPALASAAATAALGLTNALQDVPGCSIGFTIFGSAAQVGAVAMVDAEIAAATAGLVLAQFVLDGIAVGFSAVFEAAAAPERGTAALVHLLDPIAVGAHTIKLQASKTGAGAANLNTQTRMLLTIIDK